MTHDVKTIIKNVLTRFRTYNEYRDNIHDLIDEDELFTLVVSYCNNSSLCIRCFEEHDQELNFCKLNLNDT
jgi:hypothetical protein